MASEILPDSKSAEYKSWASMINRCYRKGDAGYPNYGGRGIAVCNEWRGRGGFSRFIAHIGPRPSPSHTLDRYPNNDGNYEPGNVRWATRQEQALNRRSNRRVEYHGETKTLVEWSRLADIPFDCLLYRLDHGWSVDDALSIPSGTPREDDRIEWRGRKLSVSALAKECGVDRHTLIARIRSGVSVDEAIALAGEPRPPVIITHGDQSMNVSEWARVRGIKRTTIAARIRRGWSVAKALEIE